mmetsp:Transcript_36322/g.86819  ORF Transcript_36322/g.86819 Transcript_36322/m.86819 type:complete len:100 (+) Transcript_36322:1-300(+)
MPKLDRRDLACDYSTQPHRHCNLQAQRSKLCGHGRALTYSSLPLLTYSLQVKALHLGTANALAFTLWLAHTMPCHNYQPHLLQLCGRKRFRACSTQRAV